MATEKIVNYTPAQCEELVAAYSANKSEATVVQLAESMGKSTRSIVAKLVKLGVYEGKNKEASKRTMLKSEMVSEIAQHLGKSEEALESLEKATGQALMAVLLALRAKAEEISA